MSTIALDHVSRWYQRGGGQRRVDDDLRNEQVHRSIGLVPEPEALFDYLTVREFVLANARLHGLAGLGAAADRSIAVVEMTDAAGRTISAYSKGMRQRIKMASALVHDPAVLLLDEPFNGMDRASGSI